MATIRTPAHRLGELAASPRAMLAEATPLVAQVGRPLHLPTRTAMRLLPLPGTARVTRITRLTKFRVRRLRRLLEQCSPLLHVRTPATVVRVHRLLGYRSGGLRPMKSATFAKRRVSSTKWVRMRLRSISSASRKLRGDSRNVRIFYRRAGRWLHRYNPPVRPRLRKPNCGKLSVAYCNRR
jgi:hypothetical protein